MPLCFIAKVSMSKKNGKRRQNFINQNRFEFAILVPNRIALSPTPTHGRRGEGIENLSFVFVQKKVFFLQQAPQTSPP
jgi:hypothetical protein